MRSVSTEKRWETETNITDSVIETRSANDFDGPKFGRSVKTVWFTRLHSQNENCQRSGFPSVLNIEHKNYSSVLSFWLILPLWTWNFIIDLLFVDLNFVFTLGLNYFFVKKRKIIRKSFFWILPMKGLKCLKSIKILFLQNNSKKNAFQVKICIQNLVQNSGK